MVPSFQLRLKRHGTFEHITGGRRLSTLAAGNGRRRSADMICFQVSASEQQRCKSVHQSREPSVDFASCSQGSPRLPKSTLYRRRDIGGRLGTRARTVLANAYRWDDDDEIAEDAIGASFTEGVKLFNAGDYYQCHDVLEGLWNKALDPQRSILHGILQCAVGLYHLLHQNHRGAMVELGEGVTKLRRVGSGCGPLRDFEQETSAVLEFVYSTQLEYAACSDDMCIAMDGSEQSYRLLGNFGAGQALYRLAEEDDGFHIKFVSQRAAPDESLGYGSPPPLKVKVPLLRASEHDLYKLT